MIYVPSRASPVSSLCLSSCPVCLDSSSQFLSLCLEVPPVPPISCWLFSFLLHHSQQCIFTQCTDVPRQGSSVQGAAKGSHSNRWDSVSGVNTPASDVPATTFYRAAFVRVPDSPPCVLSWCQWVLDTGFLKHLA